MSTREEMKKIWKGLTYHMMELSGFVVEKADDDYFKTTEGRNMLDRASKLTMTHLMGSFDFEKEKCGEHNEFDEMNKTLDDILKGM